MPSEQQQSEQRQPNRFTRILEAVQARTYSSKTAIIIINNAEDINEMTNALIADDRTKHVRISCRNNLGLPGCEGLASVLEQNCSLEGVDFGMNSVGDKGALFLANALRRNVTLRDINLAGNGITVEGAKALSNAAKARAIRPKLRNVDAVHVRLLRKAGGQARADYQLIRSLTGISLPIGGEGQKVLREGAFEALKIWISRELQTAPKGALPWAIEKVDGALGTFVTFEILRMIPDLFRDVGR